MKAVMIQKYGGPEVLEVVDVPEPRPKEHEVVVAVAASSVNPVDWLIRDGGAKSFVSVKFPVILGCDLAGEIVEVGAGVTRFKVGDAVFAMMPQDYGAHAERVALDEKLVVHKPAALSMQEAAAIPVVAMTALNGLSKGGETQPGEKVLVNGASGGVGMAAVQIAKSLGANVTAVCSESSFPLIKGLGADTLIDYRSTDFAAGAARYDRIFDCVGTRPHKTCQQALTGRRIHVTTQPRVGTFVRQFLNPLFGVKVFGLITRGGTGLDRIKTMVDKGELKPVIDRLYPLADIVAAQEYSKAGRAKGKIVLSLRT